MKHDGSLKLCLSSRPWDVFERAFGSSVPNTKLQDLSYEDMYRYALDTLKTDPQLRRVLKQDQEATHSLLTLIVEQADGVFLWVRLAVERMLAEHKRRDNLTTLCKFRPAFRLLYLGALRLRVILLTRISSGGERV